MEFLKTKKIISMITISLLPFISHGESIFIESQLEPGITGSAAIFTYDVNNNGRTDIIVGSAEENSVNIWYNNADGEFEHELVDSDFQGVMSLISTDLNQDGHVDIIGAAFAGGQIAWWEKAENSWTKHIVEPNFNMAHEVFATDLDADGDIDILGASAAGKVSWWANDGANPPQWTRQDFSLSFNGARSVAAGDMDGDGTLEVIAAGLSNNRISIWNNDGGSPISWSESTVTSNFFGAHRIQLRDMDGDEDLDILGAAYVADELAWFENTEGWPKHIIGTDFNGAVTIYGGDINNDGNIDILGAAQDANEISVWINDIDNGLWIKQVIDPEYDEVWPAALSDLDGDGNLDIVAGGYTSPYLKYWLQPDNYIIPQLHIEQTSGHAPQTIAFEDSSQANPPINSWEWDFQNDGIIDSYEQNPQWTYTNPGSYSVACFMSNDSVSTSILKENLISIFDGESALSFGESETYCLAEASPTLNIQDSLSIEAWIYPAGWGDNQLFGGTILYKESIWLFISESHFAFNDQSLVLKLYHADGTQSFSFTPMASIALDWWTHIAITYSAESSELLFYINGILQESQSSVNPSGLIRDGSEEPLTLASNYSESFGFDGSIDEVRFWDEVRTHDQINQNMSETLIDLDPRLQAYWSMNAGSGESLVDGSGNGNTIHLTNPTWVTGTPFEAVVSTDGYAQKPHEAVMLSNFPNPFNPSTTVNYFVPFDSNIKIVVYDITGDEVIVLQNDFVEHGNRKVSWDGRNNRGQIMPAGIYLANLRMGKYSQTVKMVIAK